MAFQVAKRTDASLCIAIDGRGGTGKSMTAYWLAHELADGGKIGVLDSERHRARLYALNPGEEMPNEEQRIAGGGRWPLLVEEIEQGTPQEYIQKIDEAAAEGIKVLVIDTFSRSWMATCDMVDQMGGWVRAGKTLTPLGRRLVDKILSYPGHVICTFRVDEKNVVVVGENGKAKIERFGDKTVARKGIEYEFMFWFSARPGGLFEVVTTRIPALPSESLFSRTEVPRVAKEMKAWLKGAAPLTECQVLEAWIARASKREHLALTFEKISASKKAGKLSEPELVGLREKYARKKAEIAAAPSDEESEVREAVGAENTES